MELLDLFTRSSEWAGRMIPKAADQLDASTPCEKWTVRDLLNHMVDAQQYFAARGRGEEAPPPLADPPDVIGPDPAASYEEVRSEIRRVYADPNVVEKTGPLLGIAFSDQLVHGWDLATATGQDATMPDGLADAALQMIGGRLTPERRGDAFAPEVEVADGATPQEKLLAYVGRKP